MGSILLLPPPHGTACCRFPSSFLPHQTQRLRLLLASTAASPPPPPRPASLSPPAAVAAAADTAAAAAAAAAAALAELAQVKSALAAKCAEAESWAEELRMVRREQQQQQHQQQQLQIPESRPMSSVGVIQALNMQVPPPLLALFYHRPTPQTPHHHNHQLPRITTTAIIATPFHPTRPSFASTPARVVARPPKGSRGGR
jgi:hypothetical protein